MTGITLRPCPFCIRTPEVMQWLESGWSIVCSDDLGALRHHIEVTGDDRVQVEAAWNSRIGYQPNEPKSLTVDLLNSAPFDHPESEDK